MTDFTTELHLELWFTDHQSWAQILDFHWFTLRFVEKTILENLAFDTSRSMIYHQNCNIFFPAERSGELDSLKQSHLETGCYWPSFDKIKHLFIILFCTAIQNGIKTWRTMKTLEKVFWCWKLPWLKHIIYLAYFGIKLVLFTVI